MTVWEDDGYTVEIRLTQFRQEEYTAALHASEEARDWAESLAGDSWLIPGTGDGRSGRGHGAALRPLSPGR